MVRLAAVTAVTALAGAGCGQTHVTETHYYAIPNGNNTNYYRLTVDAYTVLGDSEYRSGYFPTRAVDNVFGEVTTAGGVSAIAVRTELEAAYNQRVLETTKAWLQEAANPDGDPAKLRTLLETRRRILSYPASIGSPLEGAKAVEIEYNPLKGMILNHSDDKLVFILSSNPDEVIGNISNFAESEQTALSVNQLAGVVAQRVQNDVVSDEAKQTVDRKSDTAVADQIQRAIDATKADTTVVGTAVGQIDAILNLVDAVQP
jgi:hypothetical protein